MSDPTREPRKSDRVWRTLGGVLIAFLILAGLAAIAFVIIFIVAINSWGSNK